MNFLGWLGSLCLAMCGLPAAIQCYKEKHANGLNYAFLILWTVGEICVLIPVVSMGKIWLVVNYSTNLLFLLIIWYFKLKSKKS